MTVKLENTLIANSHLAKRAIINIVKETVEYIKKNEIKSLVLGLSGGIDSTLTAALAAEVCRQFYGEVHLVGRYLPIGRSSVDDLIRASLAGLAFCHSFEEKNLTEVYNRMEEELIKPNDDVVYGVENTNKRRGNIKARCRMVYLFDLAAKNRGMVLSTDNYTEYLLGFWTLHGDVGNFGMIQNLWKSEVYYLAKYLVLNRFSSDYRASLALKRAIKAMPTDGLGITESDFDQICPDLEFGDLDYGEIPEQIYKEVDDRLRLRFYEAEQSNATIEMFNRNAFKRSDPFNIDRGRILSPE